MRMRLRKKNGGEEKNSWNEEVLVSWQISIYFYLAGFFFHQFFFLFCFKRKFWIGDLNSLESEDTLGAMKPTDF